MPRLRGSSSTKPIGPQPSSGLRSISRSTSWPPSPAPTISTSRAPFAGRKPRSRGPRRQRGRANRTPSRNIEREQEEQGDHAGRERDRVGHQAEWVWWNTTVVPSDRMQQRDRADDHQRRDDHFLDDGLVVALAHECPQPLVLTEQPPARSASPRPPTPWRRQLVVAHWAHGRP